MDIRLSSSETKVIFSTARGFNITVALLKRVGVMVVERSQTRTNVPVSYEPTSSSSWNTRQPRLSVIPASYNFINSPSGASETPWDSPHSTYEVPDSQYQSPRLSKVGMPHWPESPRPRLIRTGSLPTQAYGLDTNPYHVFLGKNHFSNSAPSVGSPLANPPKEYTPYPDNFSNNFMSTQATSNSAPIFIATPPNEASVRGAEIGLLPALPKRRKLPFKDYLPDSSPMQWNNCVNKVGEIPSQLERTLPEARFEPQRRSLKRTATEGHDSQKQHIGALGRLSKPQSPGALVSSEDTPQKDIVTLTVSKGGFPASPGTNVASGVGAASAIESQSSVERSPTEIVQSTDDSGNQVEDYSYRGQQRQDVRGLLNLLKNDDTLWRVLKKRDSYILEQYEVDRAKAGDSQNLAMFYLKRLQDMRATFLCDYIATNSSTSISY